MALTKIYVLSDARYFLNHFKLEPKRKLPITVTVFFFVISFIFGFNFGFTEVFSKKMHCIGRLVNAVISLIIICILSTTLNDPDHEDFCWYLIVFLQFTISFILFNFTKYTIYDFLLELHNNNNNLHGINKSIITAFLWSYFLWYFSKLYFIYYDCEFYYPETCEMDYFPYFVYSIPSHGVDLMFLVPTLIYFYLYYCIQDIRKLLDIEMSISLLKLRYIAIIDSYEKIKPLYEKLIWLELLELPKMMGLMYNMLKYSKEQAGLFTSIGEYVYALNIIYNLILSGAVVHMVIMQVDALKIKLHNIMLDEKNSTKREEIDRFLGYMDARRLWRPVAGVIPTDLRLATTSFNIFATYMIVLVQMTHLVE